MEAALKLVRGTLGQEPTAVKKGDVLEIALGLGDIIGGDNQSRALPADVTQVVPELDLCIGVEADRWLIQEQ